MCVGAIVLLCKPIFPRVVVLVIKGGYSPGPNKHQLREGEMVGIYRCSEVVRLGRYQARKISVEGASTSHAAQSHADHL